MKAIQKTDVNLDIGKWNSNLKADMSTKYIQIVFNSIQISGILNKSGTIQELIPFMIPFKYLPFIVFLKKSEI